MMLAYILGLPVMCLLDYAIAQPTTVGGGNYYNNLCDEYDPNAPPALRPDVGTACRNLSGWSNSVATNMLLRPATLPVVITQGRQGQPNQYRWSVMPQNMESSGIKPSAWYSIDNGYSWGAHNWPICAGAGQACVCPYGRAGIFYAYDEGTFQIASVTNQTVNCEATNPVFRHNQMNSGSEALEGTLFAKRIEITTKVFCRCGQPLSPTEQWSTFTDNCLEVGSHYRTANAEGDSCMGFVKEYTDNSEYSKKHIIGEMYENFPEMTIPFDWQQLTNYGSGYGPYSRHQFSTRVPVTINGNITFKALDTFGDGWDDYGTLSLFKNANVQYDNGEGSVYVAEHSWSRQDPYTGLGLHIFVEQTGDQNVGSFQCDANYRLTDVTSDNTFKTHEQCRSLCRTIGRDCTHYSWSVRVNHVPDTAATANDDPIDISTLSFEGIGPSVMGRTQNHRAGICQTFNVKSGPLDIAGKKLNRLGEYNDVNTNSQSLDWDEYGNSCMSAGGRMCFPSEICPNGNSGSDTLPSGQPIGGARDQLSFIAVNHSSSTNTNRNWWINVGRSGHASTLSVCDKVEIINQNSNHHEAWSKGRHREELLCCFDNHETNEIADCPLHKFDNGLFTKAYNKNNFNFIDTIGAVQKLAPLPRLQRPPTVVYKHNINVPVLDRKIKGFGEDFDIHLPIKDCPPGYYCPNKVPVSIDSMSAYHQENDLVLSNYFDASGANVGIMLIKCANFPYQAMNDNSQNEDSWFSESLHVKDFGSTYNYYCPGGTPHPLRVSGNLCSGNFTDGDPYLATAEVDCPKPVILDESGNLLTNKDVGQVVKPGRTEFEVFVENSGEGTLDLNLEELPNVPWLTISPDEISTSISNDPSSGHENRVALLFAINTGQVHEDDEGESITGSIKLHWSIGGRSGSIHFPINVTAIVNDNMLVFPFAVDETVESGKQKVISVFIFNIASGGETFSPAIDNNTRPLPQFVSLNGQNSLLPCIQQAGQGPEFYNNDCSPPGGTKDMYPYKLSQKEFQRVDITLRANLKASPDALKTELRIVGGASVNGISYGVDDISVVPISMTVIPGDAEPSRTSLQFEVPSSWYYNEKTCYVDCAASQAEEGNPAFGRQWANKNTDKNIYRSCYTDRILNIEMSESLNCGDCYRQTKDRTNCATAKSHHRLVTVRQSSIDVFVNVNDIFSSPTDLSAGNTIEIILEDKNEDNSENIRTYTGIALTSADERGVYHASVVPPSSGNYSMTIVIAEGGQSTRRFNISGSPFHLEAIEPSCPPNSQAHEAGAACLCKPGYTQLSNGGNIGCTACEAGRAKAGVGNFECTDCAYGKVAKAASASCKFCPIGQGPPPKSSPHLPCRACPIAKARKYDGMTTLDIKDAECESCPTGYVAVVEGSVHCSLCPPGKEATATGDTCSACPAGKSRSGQQDTAGDYSTEATECSNCAPGKFNEQISAEACTDCEAGRYSGVEGGAIICKSCKADPDKFYAPRGSSECAGCVSPLVILSSSQASNVNDCVCPEGTYLSSGSASVSPVCTSCPVGGFCPQGTNNVSAIITQVGYWRPDIYTANFWQCPVGVIDQTNGDDRWRNWATCYGGTGSACAPVFSWREGKIDAGVSGKTRELSVLEAMRQHEIPRTVQRPELFPNFLNTTVNEQGLTLSLAIGAYMAAIHNDATVEKMGFTNFFKAVANGSNMTIHVAGQAYDTIDKLSAFIDESLVVGYMSGPLCGICPPGTGRNGDFKSDSPCEPCPVDSSANDWILVGFVTLLLVIVVFFVYSQIKKGAHEIHLENEHLRETSKQPERIVQVEENSQSEQSEQSEEKDDRSSVSDAEDEDEDEDNSVNVACTTELDDYNEEELKEKLVESDAVKVSVEPTEEMAASASSDVSQQIYDTTEVSSKHKNGRRNRRASGYFYTQDATHYSKTDQSIVKTITEHKELQQKHGTLSGNLMSHKQILTGMSRIMMSYLQVVAVARSVPILWPEEVVATLEVFAMVSAPSLSLVSVDCALGGDNAAKIAQGAEIHASSADSASGLKPVFAKFILTMCIPIVGVLVPLIFWGLYYAFGKLCMRKRKCRCCCDWADELPSQKQMRALKRFANVKTLDDRNAADHYMRVTQRLKVTIMVVFFLFYPTIVKGVFSMFACQQFGEVSYLIADMSVQCYTPEHNAFLTLASIFVLLYVFGIPVGGSYVLRRLMPGIHYDPTMPISKFNPVAGREYTRKDRAELLTMKLEASAVYGFMWEGFQQKGVAPYWEWSVIMMRKAAIIFIIQLLQNMNAEYQLTIALIIMFGFNLLHVKYHPYDLFYHDRLEMLSLVSSEMTLFGGLLITFINREANDCKSNCDEFTHETNSNASTIGTFIIFFNLLYLVYYSIGLLYHGYFVLVPHKLRCGRAEKAIADLHASIPDGMSKTLYPNHHHALIDHKATTGQIPQRQYINAESMASKIQARLNDNEEIIEKELLEEKSNIKRKIEERKRKKAAKKAQKLGENAAKTPDIAANHTGGITVEIEMSSSKKVDMKSENENENENESESESESGTGSGSESEKKSESESASD